MRDEPDEVVIRLSVDILLEHNQNPEEAIAKLQKDPKLADLITVYLLDHEVKGTVDSRHLHKHSRRCSVCADMLYPSYVLDEEYMFQI